MVRLVPSLFFAIFLVSSHHLAICSSISADVYESHDKDTGIFTPAFEESTNLEEEQRSKLNSNNAHNKKNLRADNNDNSNTNVERLLQQNWQLRMLELVNAERRRINIPEVCLNTKLNTAARGHSEDMVNRGYFDHDDPEGIDPGDRIWDANYEWWAYGENIAYNDSVEAVHRSWMRSEGHRWNILNADFEHMGLGRVFKQDGQWVQQWHTQVFGKSHKETCMTSSNPNPPPKNQQCVDSPLRFKTKLRRRKIGRFCKWVANKKTQERCKLVGARENCSKTCDSCSCADSPVKISFWFNGKYINQSCKWVGRIAKNKNERCAIGGVSRACQKTCGACS